MIKPRIIIADTAQEYATVLQLQFVKEFFGKIDLEIITDRNYFNTFFTNAQHLFILIVEEDLYNLELQKHNIDHIFVMTENLQESTGELNINRIFKFNRIQEIFNEIIEESKILNAIGEQSQKETQIIAIASAVGGAGKTKMAIEICKCLTKVYKKVLYINAGRLQNFPKTFLNVSLITSQEMYLKLKDPNMAIYDVVKPFIEKEGFYYLLPFKAALLSLGIEYSIYEKIALSVKEYKEYDFIVIDTESSFDEYLTRILDIADKVVIITTRSKEALEHTDKMMNNLNGANRGKYLFVCNNAIGKKQIDLRETVGKLKYSIVEYIGCFEENSSGQPDKTNDLSVQRLTYMIL